MMFHVGSTLYRNGEFFTEGTSEPRTLEATNERICDLTGRFLFWNDVQERTFHRQLLREFLHPDRVVAQITYQFTGSPDVWNLTYYVAPCDHGVTCFCNDDD